MAERRILWGADAVDAQYRTGDTEGDTNFVVAEDTDAGTVLLEWDDTAGEWVSQGAVNLSGNDITNAGAVTASSIDTDKASTATAPVVDVTHPDFGAVGDGTGNQSAAIQAAIDHARDNDAGVFIPGGEYRCESTLTLREDVSITGAGHVKGTTLSFIGCDGFTTGGNRVDHWSLEDIRINGDNTAETEGVHVDSYSSFFKGRDLEVNGFGSRGITQKGGLLFWWSRITMNDNGQNTTGEGRSFELLKDSSDAAPTTGYISQVYALDGGEIGFYIRGTRGVNGNILVAEYHTRASKFIGNQNGTFHGMYGEQCTNNNPRVENGNVRLEVVAGGEPEYDFSNVQFERSHPHYTTQANVRLPRTEVGNVFGAHWGIAHRKQRPEPSTENLDPGEAMVYLSDGTGAGASGDLMYAYNDGGTIETLRIAEEANAT